MNKMSWKEVLKASCGTTQKLEDDEPFEKKEVKPDYIDLDKDGNKTEPMKEAAKDAKKKKKGTNNAFMAKD